MATKILFNLFTLSLLLALRPATSDPTLSCSQTPYPQVCTSLVTTSHSSEPKTLLSFRTLVLKATMDRIMLAYQSASTMDLSLLDKGAKAAWSDCLVLYEDTIKQLNRSMDPSASHEDSQTWLSATIANHETCKSGFVELSSSLHLPTSPFMTSNISQSLSNTLAINKAMAPNRSLGRNGELLSDGFPSWVSAKDRKLLQSSSNVKANLVVAQDGSGNYRTISEAVAASAKQRSGNSRFVIYVKAGTYRENILITMTNLMLIGDGAGKTVVTGNRSVKDGSTTFSSATVAVTGGGFIAQDMTFENTAGPQKEQAVALLSGSDLSIFYRCSFKGYQDTLCTFSQRQFYRNCDIYGTVDFIFGDAVALFQGCNIYLRRPLTGQSNAITAQGRSDPNENTGISIHRCNVAAAESLGSTRSYLGRPWKEYSRTVVMKSSIGGEIDPAGWLEWDGSFALSTLYYGEYGNNGAGAGTGGRVKWAGFHVISASEASKFTVQNFLDGGSWISAAGFPYDAGL